MNKFNQSKDNRKKSELLNLTSLIRKTDHVPALYQSHIQKVIGIKNRSHNSSSLQAHTQASQGQLA